MRSKTPRWIIFWVAAAVLVLYGTSRVLAAGAQGRPDGAGGAGAQPPAGPPVVGQPPAEPGGAQPPASGGVSMPGAPTPVPTVALKPGEVPTADFDTPVYDAGRIRGGDAIRHEYFFTNNGNGMLEVLTVRPSCGCTVPGKYDRLVPPGKTGKVPVLIDTKKLKGPQDKTIAVVTNIPGEKSEVILHVKADVWQPVEVAPETCSFGRVAQQTPMERKLTILNNTDEPFEISRVESDNPCFRAEVRELEKGKKYEMTVVTVPPLRIGSTVGTISFATGLRDTPKGTVSVNAYVPSPVQVTPTQHTLPATPLNTPLQRFVSIRNNTPTPLKISGLATSNPQLRATLEEQIPGQSFRVVIDIPAGFQLQRNGETISMKTDNATMPEIVVPLAPLAGPPPGSLRTGSNVPPPTGAKAPQPVKPAPPAGSSSAVPPPSPGGPGTDR